MTCAVGVSDATLNVVPGAVEAAVQHCRLVGAAQQFEAMFIQQLLKPSDEEDAESSSGASLGGGGETYKGYGTEAMARAVAASGGLGIARQIVQKVEMQQRVQHQSQKMLPHH